MLDCYNSRKCSGAYMNLESLSKLAISFSGGETSAFMTLKAIEECQRQDIEYRVIFANTGQENEQTLEFVRDCDTHFGFNTEWIEAVIDPRPRKGVKAKVVTFETASRNGEPFEAMIKKFGIPNVSFPHCSRVLKKHAIRSHLKPWGDYYTAIGIRADEFDRASVDADKERLVYPLISMGITKNDVNRFWSTQPFRLALKGYQGNCKWCWKKSVKKLMTLANETPEVFDFPKAMEEKYGQYRPLSQPNRPLPARFFRGNRRVSDIFELTVSKPDFIKAEDDSRAIFAAKDSLEIELGASDGCGESCEAF